MITNEPETTRDGLRLYTGPIYRGMRLVLRGGDTVTVASLAVAPDYTAFTTEELAGVYDRRHIQPDDTEVLIQSPPSEPYSSCLRR